MALCCSFPKAGPGLMDGVAAVLLSLGLGYFRNTSTRGFLFTHGPAKSSVSKELTKFGRCPQRQVERHCQNAVAKKGKVPQ